jgi:NAD(P)-dependent dehydrogenase (short-subunit alcohol dehydrogenase family)
MADRSEERMKEAIQAITSAEPAPTTPSTLKYLYYNLADLNVIKAAATEFASQEIRLDIVWHNTGFGANEDLSTVQKIEGHIGSNYVSPLLFTELVLFQLKTAAKANGSARIIWTGSVLTKVQTPKSGIDFKLIEAGQCTQPYSDYATSKVGNYWLAAEYTE